MSTDELRNKVRAALDDASEVEYRSDCELIVSVAHSRLGLTLTLAEAQQIWREWSDSACAGWLFVVNENEIVMAIQAFANRRE